jgi:acetyl esterase/lipase
VKFADLLGPDGRSRESLVTKDGCLVDTYAKFQSVPAGGTFALDDATMKEVSSGMAAIGNPDQSATVGPVLIVQGATDADVPAGLTAEMASHLKDLGSDVTYREYPGLNHDQVLGPSACDQLAFLAAHGGRPVGKCEPYATDLS